MIQLQHWPSSCFLTLQNDASPEDRHCRRVCLEAEGTVGAYFYVRPSFNIRTMGSPVLTGDGILLHSVLSPSVTQALGCTAAASRSTQQPIEEEHSNRSPSPPLSPGIEQPLELAARGRRCEVNGSMEARGGFTVIHKA